MREARETMGITLIVAMAVSFSLTVLLTSGCGGTDTDKTPKKDSKDSTDNDQVEENYTPPITYKKACKKCKEKDGTCKDRSEMPDEKDKEYVSFDNEDEEKEWVIKQICDCKNNEVWGPPPRKESSCKKPCETEKVIKWYSWDCPNAHEHSDFYVTDQFNSCRLKYEGDKALPGTGDSAYLNSQERIGSPPFRDEITTTAGGGWAYVEEGELILYYTNPPDYESLKKVTCTGECIKPEKCGTE